MDKESVVLPLASSLPLTCSMAECKPSGQERGCWLAKAVYFLALLCVWLWASYLTFLSLVPSWQLELKIVPVLQVNTCKVFRRVSGLQ